MKQRKQWLWIVATLMIVVLCTAGCALADRVTDPHLQQVRKDEQLFRRLGAKGNRDSSVQLDESVLLLTETQAPSLGESGVYTVTCNPPKDTTVVSMRAYLLMRDYSDDYTAVYLLEKEGSVDTSFTTAEIVSEGYYSVVVFVTFADSENNESTYAYSYDYEIGNAASTPQLSQKIAQVVNSCRAEDAWQTALNLHDWLTNNAYYDLNYEYYGVDGVLLRGYGVCDSYSKAYQMLCDAAGVPVSRVTGWAGESHAWNAIEIDGEWYYVDVTWDDPAGAALALSGEENRDYFCLNDDLMSLDHTKDEGVFTESCTSLDANWTLRNTSEAWSSWGDWNELGNNYFSEGLQQYSEQIREQLAAGAADSFTVPCEDTFAVITGENDGRFEYDEYPADEAPAIRGWTLLGEALSRVDFDGKTAAVSYDRVNNWFAVEPNGENVCTHEGHLITVTSDQAVDYEWLSTEQHLLLKTVTSYAYCEVCGFSTDPVSEIQRIPEDHSDDDGDGVCNVCGQPVSGDWHWEYSPYGVDTTRGTLLITGSGVIPDYAAGGAPWNEYSNTIERIVLDPGIRGIGSNAFAGMNYTVRVDLLESTCPEISEQAFAGTSAICRHYTADASWPEDGETQNGGGYTITWVTLPFFDPNAEESGVTLSYSNDDGWYTLNNGMMYRMTAVQAKELSFRYRRLEMEDLPPAGDFRLLTGNWDGVMGIEFRERCNGEWTVDIPYNADADMWVANAARNMSLNLNTAQNSRVSLQAEDGTTFVTGDLDRLTMRVVSDDCIGSVEIIGNVNAMYLEKDTANNKFRGYLKVNGTVYTGRITGEADVPVTKDGRAVIRFGHIVIAETPEICQEDPIVADGSLHAAQAGNSDWTQFYSIDYWYDYSAGTCDVCLMPKGNGPDSTYIEQINPFSIDDVIYGDTNLAVINYSGEDPLLIPGDTDGTGSKTGLEQLVVQNARVKVSCPVDMLNAPENGNVWYDITIDDQVGDLWFGGENRNSRVYITGSGSVQASFLSRIFRSKLICFSVGGVGDFYSGGQLHVPYFKEGQTISYILPGDDTVAQAAGLPDDYGAMMDLEQLSEYDLSEDEYSLLGTAEDDKIAAVVDMTVSSYQTDGSGDVIPGDELHELETPVQIALTAPADVRVIRLHEDEDGLHADELEAEVSGKNDGTILFESDRFSKFVLLDNSTWGYEYEEGERMLRITGTGAVTVNGVAPWLSQGYDIARVMIDPDITFIGPNVFGGLDGRVRIDFCQEVKPEIDQDAFGTTSVVCRHTSRNESWPADGSIGNVTWAWMPTFNTMAAGTFSALSYGEEDGWAVTVQSTDDHCTGMSPETAHEVLLECYDLCLQDLPDTVELETVIGDLEGENWMLNAFWNGDTPEALTLNGNGIACATLPREILVSSDNVALNITDARTDGIHRVEVQNGTLNYTGNIETLVLTNTGEGNTGTVSVTGTIGEVAYYGKDTDAPFFGTLTVTGSVQGGLVYGGEVLMSIPGVTDSYPMGSAPGQTFGELKDLAAAVVIDTDATPVVAAELDGMTAPTIDQFTLRYMLGGENVLMLTPLEGSGLGSEPLYVMIDNYNEHFMDNLTDNIVWGSNTEIFLGMPEGSGTVILTGKDGKGVKELGTGDWTTAIVKCPVNWLYFQPDPWDHGSINLTIEGRVNNAYLQPNNCNLNITLRNGGSIGNGRWKQLLRDYRNFDSHSAPEGGTLQLVKDSALMVMSWTYAERLGAILPSDTVVGAAAGVDHAMAMLTESSVDALSVAERNALGAVTDGEAHFPVDTSQIISVFDVSVNEYTVDETGNAAIGRTVSELSQPIPVTVTNDSEETDVLVVRLHDEDGAVSAVKLDAADANGGKQFESDRFSTYLLVSRNTTATFRTITFHANNADGGEKTQDVVDGVPTALASNTFTNTGYHFIGWTTAEYLEAQEPVIVYEDEAEVTLTDDLDLYAVWELNNNGFSLDIVDITNPEERSQKYGEITGTWTNGLPDDPETVTTPIMYPGNYSGEGYSVVRLHFEPGEGYAFVGWYEAEVKDAYTQTLKPVTLLSKNAEYEFEITKEQEWVKICAVVARSAFGSSKFTVPTAMAVIEENAFEGIGATAVIVPDNCTEIKAEAFANCLNLKRILLPKDCKIDDHAFDGCADLVIYAPAGGTTQTWAEENGITFIGE